MADEELRDPVFPGKAENTAGDIGGIPDKYLRAQTRSVLQVFLEACCGGPACARLTDVEREQLPVKSSGDASPAFEHESRAGLRRDADENTFLRAPALPDAVDIHIALELVFDDLGRQ
jgi:hypothetical protein